MLTPLKWHDSFDYDSFDYDSFDYNYQNALRANYCFNSFSGLICHLKIAFHL